MLSKSTPFYYTIIAILTTVVATSAVWFYISKPTAAITKNGDVKVCNEYKIARLSGYKYIRPLVYAEHNCEAKLYNDTKSSLKKVISDFKKAGSLTSISVYLRDFAQGEWMLIHSRPVR
jgi:hypothetical protein